MTLKFIAPSPQEARSRAEWKNELIIISHEALDDKNFYCLNKNEKENLNIVLHALSFILDEIETIKQHINYCHSLLNGLVSIHFNFHTQDAEAYKVDLETYLLHLLVKPFIENYHKLKALDNEKVKTYFSKLQGTCLEIRLESAFEYANNYQNIPSFSEHISTVLKNLDISHRTYNWIFASILQNLWGEKFSADRGKNAIVAHAGVFNQNCFEFINNYLRTHLNLIPHYDFLLAYKLLPTALLETFLIHIFSQIELDTIDKNKMTNATYHNQYDLYKQLINSFARANYSLLLNLAVRKRIPAQFIAKFNLTSVMPEATRNTSMPNTIDFRDTCVHIHASIVDPVKKQSFCWVAFYVFKTVGYLSPEQIQILNSYLREQGVKLTIDFFIIYPKLRPQFKTQFYYFIFSQPEFTQNNILNFAQFSSDDDEVTEQYDKIMPLAEELYADFFKQEYKLLLIISKNKLNDREFVNNFNINARNFILNAPAEILEQIWSSSDFLQVLNQPSLFHRRLIMQAIFDKLSQPANKIYFIEIANKHFFNGETLLHYVIRFNDFDFLDQFLNYFIKEPEMPIDLVNRHKVSPLLYAARNKFFDTIPVLLSANSKAAEAQFIANEHAKQDDDEFFERFNHENLDADNRLAIENRKLIIAARNKNYDKWAEKQQLDLGHTALFVAKQAQTASQWEILFSLIESGAMLNLTPYHMTVLHTVAYRCDVSIDTFNRILNYFINVNLKYDGDTPLDAAIKSGSKDKILSLLAHKSIKCNIKQIHLAKQQRQLEILQILKLDNLIENIYLNNFNTKSDLKFLQNIDPALFATVFGNFLKRVDIDRDNIFRTQFIFAEIFTHYGKNIPGDLAVNAAPNAKIPHAEFLKLVHISNAKNAYAWQGQIRKRAYDELLQLVNTMQAPEAKLVFLREARESEIFAMHRSRFCLFAWGRTSTQKLIDGKIEELQQRTSITI